MRLISWNVNGLRACARKGFVKVLEVCDADFFCVQEVRAFPEQLDDQTRYPKGWVANFSAAERPGYSGVGIYSKTEPDQVDTSLGVEEYDVEGRFILARFGRMSIASVYFPKGNGKNRDNSRVPYKLGFYDAVKARVDRARKRGPVFVVGDFNTAHHDIDLARPKTNNKSSGFLPEERQVLTDWLDDGWVDIFRKQHPGEPGHYTWWRQWGDAKKNNVGWRIDYIYASTSAAKRIDSSYILRDVDASDHCPIGIDFT